MTTAEWVLVATAVGIGLPAAVRIDWPRVGVRNVTALMLVLSWAAGFIAWYGFAYPFSPFLMFYIDWFVIAVIMCKARRSVFDWVVIGLFVPAWVAYFGGLSAYAQWWLLWYVCLAQFGFAGTDSLFSSLRSAKADSQDMGTTPPGLQYAWTPAAGGEYG